MCSTHNLEIIQPPKDFIQQIHHILDELSIIRIR